MDRFGSFSVTFSANYSVRTPPSSWIFEGAAFKVGVFNFFSALLLCSKLKLTADLFLVVFIPDIRYHKQ